MVFLPVQRRRRARWEEAEREGIGEEVDFLGHQEQREAACLEKEGGTKKVQAGPTDQSDGEKEKGNIWGRNLGDQGGQTSAPQIPEGQKEDICGRNLGMPFVLPIRLFEDKREWIKYQVVQ